MTLGDYPLTFSAIASLQRSDDGAEKLRYITGYADAFDNFGMSVAIRLNNICGFAHEEFGIVPNGCSD